MYPFGRVKQISHDITILPEIVNRRVLIKVHTDHSAGEWLLFVVDTFYPDVTCFYFPGSGSIYHLRSQTGFRVVGNVPGIHSLGVMIQHFSHDTQKFLNPYYMAVQDCLDTGVPSVQVLRVGSLI